ncbi:MAG TPA: hypothetical protein VGF59_32715 [Bryobacteraceae bacterium]
MKLARLLLCLGAVTLGAQQDPNDAGPANLIITYRCAPEKRVALREYMRAQGLRRFEDLRRNTVLANYRVYFSRYVDTNNWDMMAVLTFAHFSDFDKWQRVERETPAGLPPEMLAQLLYVSTYPVDLVAQKAADERPLHPVSLVVPYARTVGGPEYQEYFATTVRPQIESWMAKGVVTRYDLLAQRYGMARPWDGLLILEFKDDASTSAKVLGDARRNPAAEREAILADELVLNR